MHRSYSDIMLNGSPVPKRAEWRQRFSFRASKGKSTVRLILTNYSTFFLYYEQNVATVVL